MKYVRGQSRSHKRKPKHKEQILEKQKIFACEIWRNHRKLFTQLKKIDETTYYVVTVFYGFGRKKPLENCETIRRMLARRGVGITYDMVHAYKWAGLLLLGWEGPVDERYKNKAEALLKELEAKTKEGETKMTPQEEFAKVKAALILKKESDNDFGSLLEKIELAYTATRRGNLYLKGIFMKITNGESLTDIMNDLGVSERFVITVAGVIFCFAWPEKMTERLGDVRTEYLELKRMLENYEHTQAQKVSVLPPSEGIEDTIHEKVFSDFILVPIDLSVMEEDPTFFVADVDCVVGEKPLSILCSDGRKGDIRRLPSQLADDEIIFFNDAFKEGIKIVKQRESGSDNGTLYFIRI